MSKPLYVTTTIPYVNAPPHIGFALELVQADAYARYHRLTGRTVRLQTGTDENAFKNVLSARALAISTEQLVDDNAARFRALAAALNVSYDAFVRTTSPAHHEAVHALLSRLRTDDVYRASYRGLYCDGCEDFYLPRELVDGRCPDHSAALTEVEEHNWFFRLSAYQSTLHELIAARRLRVVPESREAEVLRFIESGLADISISRDAARSGGWGIPFPGDASQIVYVWIDALVNYLTGLGFPESCGDFWSADSEKLHVIGKNVWKFHAVYWPALLLSAGLPLPDTIFAHGFLTIDGQKIAKSRAGQRADPFPPIDQFGSDAVRYYLLRHIRPTEDTDYTAERLADVYESELANGLGNLCSRLTTLCESAGVTAIASQTTPPPQKLDGLVKQFRFDRAIALLWEEVDALNREIAEARPWADLKAGRLEIAQARLRDWAGTLSALAHWLQPFLPDTASRIGAALRRAPIRKIETLFPRIASEAILQPLTASSRSNLSPQIQGGR
jgi:methionyl-tRNA synthetase